MFLQKTPQTKLKGINIVFLTPFQGLHSSSSTMIGLANVAILVVCLAAAWLGKSCFDFLSRFLRNRNILLGQLPSLPEDSFIGGHAGLLGPPKGYLNLANALKKHGKTLTLRLIHRQVRLFAQAVRETVATRPSFADAIDGCCTVDLGSQTCLPTCNHDLSGLNTVMSAWC